jgi:glycerate 2-kinase
MPAPDSLERAHQLGLKPPEFLANNASKGFFRVLGDPVITWPTLTNINDFRAMLIFFISHVHSGMFESTVFYG